MAGVSQSELECYRCMDVSAVLPRLTDYLKADPTVEPTKDHATAR
jgi:hypothetical protein